MSGVEGRMRTIGELPDGRPLYYADESFTEPGYKIWDPERAKHISVTIEPTRTPTEVGDGALGALDWKRLDELLRDPACEGLEFVERREAEAALRSTRQDSGDRAHALLDRIEGMVEEWESSAATDGWSLASRIASVLGDRDVPSPPTAPPSQQDAPSVGDQLEQAAREFESIAWDCDNMAAEHAEADDGATVDWHRGQADAYRDAAEKLRTDIGSLSTEKPGGES